MNKPILYIASPVYNIGEPLRDFLIELDTTIPLLSQLGVEVRCLAVDDKSDDFPTRKILRKPPIELTVLRHEKNRGCCAALATALDYVSQNSESEDFMAWLDSDGEHRPMQLIGMLPLLQRNMADLALCQIIFQPGHMPEYDRKLQESVGALEARMILGPDHQWHQHAPGYWLVKCSFVKKIRSDNTFHNYLNFYHREAGVFPRWGEDMSFVKCVSSLGGRVNYNTITTSHMKAPNRPEEKVLAQYLHALQHLTLYSKFF